MLLLGWCDHPHLGLQLPFSALQLGDPFACPGLAHEGHTQGEEGIWHQGMTAASSGRPESWWGLQTPVMGTTFSLQCHGVA